MPLVQLPILYIMANKINTTSKKDKTPNGNNGHRKEKSRNSRGTVRPEVQVPGGKAGNRGANSAKSQRSNTRGTRHDASHEPAQHRPPDQLGSGNHSVPDRNRGLVNHNLRPKISERQAQLMLERLTRDHLLNNPNAIIRLDDTVRAFGRYTITRTPQCFQVYRSATLAVEPSSSKVAISWCVADKYGKDSLARDLISFDQEVERRSDEIMYYRKTLADSQDSVQRFVAADRLSESLIRLKYAQEQLAKCVNLAKYWQLKGFKDETARIGIKN